MISATEKDAIRSSAIRVANQIMEQGADAVIVIVATTGGDGKAESFRAFRGNPYTVLGVLASEHQQMLSSEEQDL